MRIKFSFLSLVLIVFASNAAATDGTTMYKDKCSACHEEDGSGLPGMAPPLKSALWKQLGAKGPAYFAAMVLNGASGTPIDGEVYAGVMPTWSAQLTDDDVAAIGNHVLHDFNAGTQKLTPADVAAVRAKGHIEATQLQAVRGGAAP